MARARIDASSLDGWRPIYITGSGAGRTPIFDRLLITYTLCTISDTESALRGLARALRPGGNLIFCEHGAAPDANIRRWQDRMNPLRRRVPGGCNLNRAIPELNSAGGFDIDRIETMYLPGWRPAGFNDWESASPR